MNKKYSNLVVHASKDYNMDIETVNDIYNKYPNEFYERLEDYIKERNNYDY